MNKKPRKRYRSYSSSNVSKFAFAKLCKRYGNKCLCCGQKVDKLTMDHVVPRSDGGADSIENIQPLCRSCNELKGTQIIDFRVLNVS